VRRSSPVSYKTFPLLSKILVDSAALIFASLAGVGKSFDYHKIRATKNKAIHPIVLSILFLFSFLGSFLKSYQLKKESFVFRMPPRFIS
jgi:hypothetical protein